MEKHESKDQTTDKRTLNFTTDQIIQQFKKINFSSDRHGNITTPFVSNTCAPRIKLTVKPYPKPLQRTQSVDLIPHSCERIPELPEDEDSVIDEESADKPKEIKQTTSRDLALQHKRVEALRKKFKKSRSNTFPPPDESSICVKRKPDASYIEMVSRLQLTDNAEEKSAN